MWLRLFKHLLPSGKAWSLTVDKTLRQFFQGLADALGPGIKTFFDEIWGDLHPQTTRELAQWEDQWGLIASGLTEQQRRDRLDAAWKAVGGQSPRYIQDTLQANGFDVYVHEFWVPGTEPAIGVQGCATVRNPIAYLRREFTGVSVGVDCGEAEAACGEAFAECGNGIEPLGYPLVNRILRTEPDIIPLCGEFIAACGEEDALCGNYENFITVFQNYIVPSEPDKWPFFLYIGASDIDDVATLDVSRREEFETLCLKICPGHLWLGILVEYA